MKVNKDVYFNSLNATTILKIPRYEFLSNVGDEFGMQGDIVVETSTGDFCWHDGVTWQCVSAGGGGTGIFGIQNIGNGTEVYVTSTTSPALMRTLQSPSGTITIGLSGSTQEVDFDLNTGSSVFINSVTNIINSNVSMQNIGPIFASNVYNSPTSNPFQIKRLFGAPNDILTAPIQVEDTIVNDFDSNQTNLTTLNMIGTTLKNTITIYVNNSIGNDDLNGLQTTVLPNGQGPVRTIDRAFEILRFRGYHQTAIIQLETTGIDYVVGARKHNWKVGQRGRMNTRVIIRGGLTNVLTGTVTSSTANPIDNLQQITQGANTFAPSLTGALFVHPGSGFQSMLGNEQTIGVTGNTMSVATTSIAPSSGTFDVFQPSVTIAFNDGNTILESDNTLIEFENIRFLHTGLLRSTTWKEFDAIFQFCQFENVLSSFLRTTFVSCDLQTRYSTDASSTGVFFYYNSSGIVSNQWIIENVESNINWNHSVVKTSSTITSIQNIVVENKNQLEMRECIAVSLPFGQTTPFVDNRPGSTIQVDTLRLWDCEHFVIAENSTISARVLHIDVQTGTSLTTFQPSIELEHCDFYGENIVISGNSRITQVMKTNNSNVTCKTLVTRDVNNTPVAGTQYYSYEWNNSTVSLAELDDFGALVWIQSNPLVGLNSQILINTFAINSPFNFIFDTMNTNVRNFVIELQQSGMVMQIRRQTANPTNGVTIFNNMPRGLMSMETSNVYINVFNVGGSVTNYKIFDVVNTQNQLNINLIEMKCSKLYVSTSGKCTNAFGNSVRRVVLAELSDIRIPSFNIDNTWSITSAVDTMFEFLVCNVILANLSNDTSLSFSWVSNSWVRATNCVIYISFMNVESGNFGGGIPVYTDTVLNFIDCNVDLQSINIDGAQFGGIGLQSSTLSGNNVQITNVGTNANITTRGHNGIIMNDSVGRIIRLNISSVLPILNPSVIIPDGNGILLIDSKLAIGVESFSPSTSVNNSNNGIYMFNSELILSPADLANPSVLVMLQNNNGHHIEAINSSVSVLFAQFTIANLSGVYARSSTLDFRSCLINQNGQTNTVDDNSSMTLINTNANLISVNLIDNLGSGVQMTNSQLTAIGGCVFGFNQLSGIYCETSSIELINGTVQRNGLGNVTGNEHGITAFDSTLHIVETNMFDNINGSAIELKNSKLRCGRIFGLNNGDVGINILTNAQVVNQDQGLLSATTVTGLAGNYRVNGVINTYAALAVAPFSITDPNVFSGIMRN